MEATNMSDKWHERFMEMAQMISSWSKDPSTKCGCVITCNREVVGMGYNGFPHGVLGKIPPERRAQCGGPELPRQLDVLGPAELPEALDYAV